MKIIDGIKTELDEIHGTLLIMQNAIKGLNTPCCLCKEGERKCKRKVIHYGICESFILKEKNDEMCPREYR